MSREGKFSQEDIIREWLIALYQQPTLYADHILYSFLEQVNPRKAFRIAQSIGRYTGNPKTDIARISKAMLDYFSDRELQKVLYEME